MKQRIVANKYMLEHPLLAIHALVKPHRPNKSFACRFRAWSELSFDDSTVQVIPGIGGVPITLDLSPTTAVMQDFSLAWNWQPKDTKAWLSDLASFNFITDDLCTALTRCIGHVVLKKRAPIAPQTRSEVLMKTSGKCAYCGVVLTTAKGMPNTYHADHVLPVTLGGSDDIANLIPACAKCNTNKAAKTMLRFSDYLGKGI